MDINATFIGQIVVFLILLWFIGKFVVPPLSAAVSERQKKIAEGLAAADRGQKDLDEAKARAEEIVREARDRANQIVDQASRRSNEIGPESFRRATQSRTSSAGMVLSAPRTDMPLSIAELRLRCW